MRGRGWAGGMARPLPHGCGAACERLCGCGLGEGVESDGRVWEGRGQRGREGQAVTQGRSQVKRTRTTLLPFPQNTSTSGGGGLRCDAADALQRLSMLLRVHGKMRPGNTLKNKDTLPQGAPRPEGKTTDVDKLKIFWKFYSESVLTRVGFICVAGDHAKKNAALNVPKSPLLAAGSKLAVGSGPPAPAQWRVQCQWRGDRSSSSRCAHHTASWF